MPEKRFTYQFRASLNMKERIERYKKTTGHTGNGAIIALLDVALTEWEKSRNLTASVEVRTSTNGAE